MNAVEYFRQHEGVIPHMYLDIVGLVTVGVGFMLRSATVAASYKFLDAAGRDATREQIEDEWRRIKGMPYGMDKPASFYRSHCTLHLPEPEIDRQLRTKLDDFRRGVVSVLPNFGNLRPDQQTGLLDMAYSLGVSGWTNNYPRMMAAIKAKRWNVVAAECRRKNVSDARNLACARLFDPSFAGWPDATRGN